ncbi:MAG: alkaline phosphatase family protein [Anaerolineales bacterium]|nr:alkaline phosphatase family protein [Anaerolineales bacterium]
MRPTRWLPAALLALGLLACGRLTATPAPAATASPHLPAATPSAAATGTLPATVTALPPTPAASPSPPIGVTSPAAPTAGPTAGPPPPVVILSFDGLRADAAETGNLPNLHALAARGAYTYHARTTFPPATLPSHASMLSGVGPEVHGLLWNDTDPARGLIGVPTIFSVAHEAGLTTVLVAGKEKFLHFNLPGTIDRYTFVTNGDQGIADQAVVEAQAGFDLLMVHFPNPDYFGHLDGWMSATYLYQLKRTDDALGRLLAALPPQAVVIATADHGGHGFVHGADLPADMTIPWIIAGPGVRQNYALTGPVTTTDTAVTAAYLLGLTFPGAVAGRPVWEAFTNLPPLVTQTTATPAAP